MDPAGMPAERIGRDQPPAPRRDEPCGEGGLADMGRPADQDGGQRPGQTRPQRLSCVWYSRARASSSPATRISQALLR